MPENTRPGCRQQPSQDVRRDRRRRRCLVDRPGRGDLRHPRPERRRQDHHRRVDRRPPDAGRRHDPRPRPGSAQAAAAEITSLVGVQLQASELPGPDQGSRGARAVRVLLPVAGRSGRTAGAARPDEGAATPPSPSCPAGRSSGCRSRSRWSATRRSRSSTSSPPASIRRPAATPGSWSSRSATAA